MRLHIPPVIYGVREDGIQTVSDFMVPFVMLLNDSGEAVTLREICFSAMGSGRCIEERRLSGGTIGPRFRAAAEEWKLYRPVTWERTLGLEEAFPPEELCTGGTLMPGRRAVLHQEFFRVHHAHAVEGLIVQVSWDGGAMTRRVDIALNPQKNSYRFPIRRPCYATGAYIDPDAHRWCRNSEFAIDVGLPAPDGRLDPDAILGEPVYAAADGTVLRAFDGVGEHETDPELLEERYGNDVRVDGNHVVLEHGEGECSLYAHLLRLSRPWRQGETVKCGDLLGFVGSSGHSACPHLHFHVFIREGGFGPSIPVAFTDLVDIYGDPLEKVIRDDMLVFPQSSRI